MARRYEEITLQEASRLWPHRKRNEIELAIEKWLDNERYYQFLKFMVSELGDLPPPKTVQKDGITYTVYT